MSSDDQLVVFLDANVLVRPVTRTLILRCAPSGYVAVWSELAEAQANRHLSIKQTPLAAVRAQISLDLSGTGVNPGRFGGTSPPDRQILADAEAAGATFLVTDDVDDFAPTDLGEASVSAVNPDLFLSVHTDSAVYQTAIEHMVKNMRNPARTAKELHGAISRQHPRLFAAHQDLFSVPSQSTGQRQPAVVFRGNTCLRCLSSFAAGIDSTGICDVCRATYPANVRR